MEQVQSRVQEAVDSMLTNLDTDCLRKMQRDMYDCCSNCCGVQTGTMADVQRCVESCTIRTNTAQQIMQKELENYQGRLQRCALECKDLALDQMGGKKEQTEAFKTKCRSDMETCVVKCGDTHVGLVPAMFERLKQVLAAQAHH